MKTRTLGALAFGLALLSFPLVPEFAQFAHASNSAPMGANRPADPPRPAEFDTRGANDKTVLCRLTKGKIIRKYRKRQRMMKKPPRVAGRA